MTMDVLLANPKSVNAFESFGMVFPPLGLLYVAAAAERAGFTVGVEDFFVSRNKPSRFDFRDYDVVGITSDTRRFPGALEIAKRAKQQGCTVVMGGPHPAFVDDDVLMGGYADFIVKGEGEISFPDLLETIKRGDDPCQVKGISYLVHGNVTRTAPRDLVEDLDSLPFPARHLVDIDAYKRFGVKYGGKRPLAILSTSRGCPNACEFCATPQMYGGRWRARTPESVVSEIEHVYHDYGYRAIAFCDDNFTVSPRRVREICRLLIEKNLDIWWWSFSTTTALLRNEDMVSLMAKAGAKTVYIGVESPDPETLKELNKDAAVNAPSEAVALLKRNKLDIFASYILGGMNEDTAAILRTIRFARSLDTSIAQFSILTPYPGTVLFNKVKDRLRHKKWRLYDGTHLVFRHEHVPYVSMQLLLIWAYVSYYARGWRAIRGFVTAFVKNTPLLKVFWGRAR
jgi:anaerobic magnesium-protoporphyrin IX monomethyl ester cyclase